MDSLNSPRVKKVRSKVKSMIIVAFDSKETVHKEFILAGHTVNSAYYCHDL
jgi:hypothetical protein